MSSRVERDNETRRLEQQRVAEQRRSEGKDGGEKFAKALNQTKAETGQTLRKEKKAAQQKVAQRGAQAALMARSGIAQNAKFQNLLQNAGQENLVRGRTLEKTADKQKKQERVDADADSKEAVREMDQGQDRVEAVDGDRGGQGGGQSADGGSGDHDGGFQSSLGGVAAAGGVAGAQQTAAPQGANAPQLPPEVIQQIVKRVMVGVDTAGMSTFVVQLQQNILGGGTLQINAKDGKIAATFSTRDKNAARLLKASEGRLARAFARRGLSLESLQVVTQ